MRLKEIKWLLRSHRQGPKPGLSWESGSLQQFHAAFLEKFNLFGVASKGCATGYSSVTWVETKFASPGEDKKLPLLSPGSVTVFSPPTPLSSLIQCLFAGHWLDTWPFPLSAWNTTDAALPTSFRSPLKCHLHTTIFTPLIWMRTNTPCPGQPLSSALAFFMSVFQPDKWYTALVYPLTLIFTKT